MAASKLRRVFRSKPTYIHFHEKFAKILLANIKKAAEEVARDCHR